jgi:hypothetical protein
VTWGNGGHLKVELKTFGLGTPNTNVQAFAARSSSFSWHSVAPKRFVDTTGQLKLELKTLGHLKVELKTLATAGGVKFGQLR